MIGFLLAAVFFFFGCSGEAGRASDQVLSYTQDAVCTNSIDEAVYDIFTLSPEMEYIIPGLRQNFVPQGIGFWKERDVLLISGYFKPVENAAGIILAVSSVSGELVGEYQLLKENGTAVTGHFAGLAITGTDLFVTGDGCLYRIALKDITGAKKSLQVRQTIPVSVETAACNFSDGILWICEHYRRGDAPLRKPQTMISNDGEEYHAWMVGYQITAMGRLRPYCVFAVPDCIQGITVTDGGTVVLTQSYGRANGSKLFLCRDPRESTPDGYVTMGQFQVPLWYLDGENGWEVYDAPPMAEGCCAHGGKLYLLFESAAYYYRAFDPANIARDPTDRIWKMDIP